MPTKVDLTLSAGNGSDNQERFFPRGNRFGQRRVGRFVGPVLLAGEEAQERAPLLRPMIADGAAQHGIASLQCVEDGALRDWAVDFERYFAADVSQGSQVLRKFDSNHCIHSVRHRLLFLTPHLPA